MLKADVRSEARNRGLAVADKPDSHDICFIANGDTAGFLEQKLGHRPGDIVDMAGAKVGEHAGSHRFTVGQRRGLHLGQPASDGQPRFVLAITPTTNTITVGPRDALAVSMISTIRPTWTGQPPGTEWAGEVQVRAHGLAMQNREQAMRMLRARLTAAAEEEAANAASAARRSQVRTVDRSERIRTYNFPENRISDHRIGFKSYNLDQVLNGDLDAVVKALQEADTQLRLSQVGGPNP